MNILTVFSRPGCHLCDEMLFVLRDLQPRNGFDLAVENVDSREDWLADHGNRVPVLVANNGHKNTELCCGRIDDAAVLSWLNTNIADG